MKRLTLLLSILPILTVVGLKLLSHRSAGEESSPEKIENVRTAPLPEVKAKALIAAPSKSSSRPPEAEARQEPLAEKIAPQLSEILTRVQAGILPIRDEQSLMDSARAQNRAPQVLLDWSFDLGQAMLQAFSDSAKAPQTYDVLKSCFSEKDFATPYRALCAANAKRLAQRFPDRFAQDFADAARDLPDSIFNFLGTVEARNQ